MLKKDWRDILVLLAFCFLLREVLTVPTLLFAALGAALVLGGVRTNRLVRNALALGVFGSYWLKYGKIIDPEVGLNFLTSVIVLKILEKETVRDRYMIFFGLLLLISAGSLFERTLGYVFFFSASFLVLIRGFYGFLGQRWRLKDLGLALLWVLPFTVFLFFLVPRLLSPIPFQQNTSAPGEIGYTPDVNISQIEALEANQSPVFHVVTSRALYQSELYWRGNTLSYTDGWNWKEMVQDKGPATPLLGAVPSASEVTQSFRLFTRAEYFFTLDVPRIIVQGRDVLGINGKLKTLAQRRWETVQRYEVYSRPGDVILETAAGPNYLKVPLSRKEKDELRAVFPGATLAAVTKSLRDHFVREKFVYSLAPGRSETLRAFLERRVGLCSHYASLTAIVLRLKGIPARLVSGFMGGNYNKFANFYLVSQNDAHVWVEAFAEGRWVRLDPTGWIAPERVQLGGDAFMERVQGGTFRKNPWFRIPSFVNELRQWFGQWDFLFYQWLEEMDYHAQETWLERLKFKRQWLFSLIPLVMVTFMLAYTWFLSRRRRREERSPHLDLWRLLYKKIEKRGLVVSPVSLAASREALAASPDAELRALWDDLVAASFREDPARSLRELEKRIRRL